MKRKVLLILVLALFLIATAFLVIFLTLPVTYLDCGTNATCLDDALLNCRPAQGHYLRTAASSEELLPIEEEPEIIAINGREITIEPEPPTITTYNIQTTIDPEKRGLCPVTLHYLEHSSPNLQGRTINCLFPITDLEGVQEEENKLSQLEYFFAEFKNYCYLVGQP